MRIGFCPPRALCLFFALFRFIFLFVLFAFISRLLCILSLPTFAFPSLLSSLCLCFCLSVCLSRFLLQWYADEFLQVYIYIFFPYWLREKRNFADFFLLYSVWIGLNHTLQQWTSDNYVWIPYTETHQPEKPRACTWCRNVEICRVCQMQMDTGSLLFIGFKNACEKEPPKEGYHL